MLWLVVAELLLQASVAYHDLVIVDEPSLLAVVTSGTTWCTVAPSQTSLAVGSVNVGVAPQAIVASAPALPIVGPVLSTMVIVWLRVPDVLPQSSTAFQVLVTVLA